MFFQILLAANHAARISCPSDHGHVRVGTSIILFVEALQTGNMLAVGVRMLVRRSHCRGAFWLPITRFFASEKEGGSVLASLDSQSALLDKIFCTRSIDQIKPYLSKELRDSFNLELFSKKLAEHANRFSARDLSKLVFLLGGRCRQGKTRTRQLAQSLKDLLRRVDKQWDPADVATLACGMARAGLDAFESPDLLLSQFGEPDALGRLENSVLVLFAEALLYHKQQSMAGDKFVDELLSKVVERLGEEADELVIYDLLFLANQLAQTEVLPDSLLLRKVEQRVLVQLPQMSDVAFERLCDRMLSVQQFQVGVAAVVKEFLSRAAKCEDRTFLTTFCLLSGNGLVDRDILQVLRKIIEPVGRTFSAPVIVAFLSHLSRPTTRAIPEASEIGGYCAAY